MPFLFLVVFPWFVVYFFYYYFFKYFIIIVLSAFVFLRCYITHWIYFWCHHIFSICCHVVIPPTKQIHRREHYIQSCFSSFSGVLPSCRFSFFQDVMQQRENFVAREFMSLFSFWPHAMIRKTKSFDRSEHYVQSCVLFF